MFRRILAVLSVILVLVVSISGIAYGAWAYKFPVIIQDTSATNRTYTPVILASNGQQFVDGGYITSSGLSTNMQDGTASRKYMLSTTKILTVVPTLPSGGQVTHDLFTGYTPAQTGFPIITGTDGYVTTTDAAPLELGNGFEIEQKGYVDVTAGSNKNLVKKATAVSVYVDSTTTGKINATIGKALPALPSAQVIVGGSDSAMAASTTRYNVLMGGGVWNNTESINYQVMPTAGTISQMYIRLSANVGAGTAIFTLMKNSAPQALTVTINTGASTGSDLTNSVSFVAGDTVSLRYVASGASGTPYASWTTLWSSTVTNESIFLANDKSDTTSIRYFLPQGYSTETNLNDASGNAPMPTAGTFSKMYIKLSEDPGDPAGPDRYKFMLRKAAGDTTLTVTVTADSTTGNNTANTVAVVAGDLVGIQIIPENAPSAFPYAAIGMVFTPTTPGESVIMGGGGGSARIPSTTATNYNLLSGESTTAWTATENTVYQLTQFAAISKLYVKLLNAPNNGAGVQSFTFNVREAGGATGLTVTVSEAATTGNDTTHSFLSTDGAVTTMQTVPANTPVSGNMYWGLVSRYISVTVSVSGLSSEEKTVTTTLTGGTLTLTVTPGGTNNVAFADAVPDNANDWYFAQNNVMPYADYITLDVAGVEVLRYQPNTMLVATALPDRATADGTQNGTITWGSNVGITFAYRSLVSYESTASTAQTMGGFTMPAVPAPSNWWAAGADVASLPFYDAFNLAATQSGIPIQTIYLLPIWGLAFAMLFLVTGGTRSLFMGIIAMAIVLFIGSEMTVIPKWQPFMLLVLDFGVIFIQRQMGY